MKKPYSFTTTLGLLINAVSLLLYAFDGIAGPAFMVPVGMGSGVTRYGILKTSYLRGSHKPQ